MAKRLSAEDLARASRLASELHKLEVGLEAITRARPQAQGPRAVTHQEAPRKPSQRLQPSPAPTQPDVPAARSVAFLEALRAIG